MSKTFDFDAFWAEAMPDQDSRPKVRVFGEDVYLPASIPARIVLKAMRAAEADDDANRVLSLEEIYEQACALYTKERIDAWMDRGLTFKQLDDLVGHGLRLYMGAADEGEGDSNEGNDQPPKRG